MLELNFIRVLGILIIIRFLIFYININFFLREWYNINNGNCMKEIWEGFVSVIIVKNREVISGL